MANTSKIKICLVGEAYDENEQKINAPFVGASGIELLRMLDEAGVITLTSVDFDYINKYYRAVGSDGPMFIDMIWRLHPELHRTNVFMQHSPANRLEWFCGPRSEGIRGYPALIKGKAGGYVRQEFIPELERLGDELVELDPNLIICFGNTALWALCGTSGVSKLRGTTSVSTHTVTGIKCLACYHPAAVLRQWENRPVTVLDLMKAKREAEYPEIRRPKYTMWLEPTIADLYEFYDKHIQHSKLLSVDIETAGNQITCIGFAPTTELALVVPFTDYRKRGGSYWPSAELEKQAWLFVKMVCESPIPKVGQNMLYDVAFTWRSYGICIRNVVHDDMLLHHALQPESLKGLGFLGSIYTNWPSWKGMRAKETIKRDD